jgi:hypothetical protein
MHKIIFLKKWGNAYFKFQTVFYRRQFEIPSAILKSLISMFSLFFSEFISAFDLQLNILACMAQETKKINNNYKWKEKN